MALRAFKSAVVAFGLLGAVAAWVQGGTTLDAYSQHQGLIASQNGGDLGRSERGVQILGVDLPSEWAVIAIGLVLVGAIAHRRQSKD